MSLTTSMPTFGRAAALAAALAVFVPPAAAASNRADAGASTMAVTRAADGVYQVRGRFTVPGRADQVWAVLTDYTQLPSFVTSMRRSTVAAGPDGRLLVTQEAKAKVGPFSRTLHVILEVTERERERIDFHEISGRSFSTYSGSWVIQESAEAVTVSYLLDAKPHSAPPLFARSILAGNAQTLLDQVRTEILRRGGRPSPDSATTSR